MRDGEGQLEPRSRAEPTRSAIYDVAMQAAVAVVVLGGVLLFYGSFRAVHQDLAGSVLSGRLAVTLGDSYGHYSLYFPPAERWWFSLAARLSDWTGLRLDLAAVLMTAAAVLISAELAYRIRRQAAGASPLFFVGSVAALAILPILFKNIFGLREPMVAVGLWPYLVLRVSDPDGTRIGRSMRLLVGAWVGTMLLAKYLYALVVFLVEIADVLVQRRPRLLFRIENIVAGAIVALYLLVWLGLHPEQRAAIGAMASALDAALVDHKTNALKIAENLGYALVFVALLVHFRVPKRTIALGLAIVVAAILVAASQGRWYTHHLFPIFLGYVAWWWIAKRHFHWWVHAALALCLSYPLITQFLNSFPYQRQVAELDGAMTGAGLSVKGKRVGLLNMHPSPYNEYLAAHGGVRWNALMNNAYVGAELKPFDTEENVGKLPPPVKLDDPGRRMLHEQMLSLWEDRPPDVLILDHSTSWPLRYIKVDWLHEFSEDPRFNAIMRHYRPVLDYRGKRISFTYYFRAD